MEAAEAAAQAAREASVAKRDEDAKKSKDKKTVASYTSTWRNFYLYCRATGRNSLVPLPPTSGKEKLQAPQIFDDCDHAAILARESEIFSCFISWLANNRDGSISSSSRQQGGRSACCYYVRSRVPPRQLSEASEALIKQVMQGQCRAIVAAKESGLMKASR